MTFTRGVLSLTTAVLLLAVVAACGSDPDPDGAPSTSPSITSSPSTTSSTPATPKEQAGADASAATVLYYATIDELRQDATAPLSRLDSVAVGTQLSAQEKFLTNQRDGGLLQVGDTKVIETKVQSISLDNSDPASGRVPTVTIDVCWDVSNADLMDSSGESVVAADRADRGWTRLTVANYSWDSEPENGWRVAGGEDLEKKPCDG